MSYCKYCKRQVRGTKTFNWGAFLILCFTGIGGIFYLLYWIVKGKQCPICNSKL